MEDNSYFKKALGDFSFDVAAGAAIRHLYDAGLSVDEIKDRLDYPTSKEKIQSCIDKYLRQKEEEASTGVTYKIIKETDPYGRTSFRRVRKDDKEI